jgi:hypothetical protein
LILNLVDFGCWVCCLQFGGVVVVVGFCMLGLQLGGVVVSWYSGGRCWIFLVVDFGLILKRSLILVKGWSVDLSLGVDLVVFVGFG